MLNIPDPYEDQFEKRKKAKKERVAKNELQRLRNIARSQKSKGKSYTSHNRRGSMDSSVGRAKDS